MSADTCTRCGDTKEVSRPICRRGSDHAGRNCGGTICGEVEAPCPACQEVDDTPADAAR